MEQQKKKSDTAKPSKPAVSPKPAGTPAQQPKPKSGCDQQRKA